VTRTLSEDSPTERFKRAAAEAAAVMVRDGMRVGLGTGSTVAFLLPALAERKLHGLRCVATSPATEHLAQTLGLIVEDLDALCELDIAIDGADQVDPNGWLVKGGGAAQTREKIVAPRPTERERRAGERGGLSDKPGRQSDRRLLRSDR
jgi:ribose 5-phosphate isomerase A